MKKIIPLAIVFVVAFSTFSILITNSGSETDNEYWRRITVDNSRSSETLSDYQVFLNVTYDSDMQPDFDDLRFTWYDKTSGQEVVIDYWLDKYVDSEYALVWVEVPSIQGLGQEVLYMYYGDPDTAGESNGEETFVFFDDFSIDTTANYEILPSSDTIGTPEIGWDTNGWFFLNSTFAGNVRVRPPASLIDATKEKYWLETRAIGFGPGRNDHFGVWQMYEYDSNPTIWYYALGCFIREVPQIVSIWGGVEAWEFREKGLPLPDNGKYAWYRFGVGTSSNGTVVGRFYDDNYDEIVTLIAQTIHHNDEWWITLAGGRVDIYFDYIRVRKFTDPEPSYLIGPEEPLPATVDIDPDTLNLKSNGQWITAYVTLPEDYSVEDVDVTTVNVTHNDFVLTADWGEVQDSVLMVKFDRAALRDYLGAVDVDDGDKFYDITLTVIGDVAGTTFEGSDTITVKRQ